MSTPASTLGLIGLSWKQASAEHSSLNLHGKGAAEGEGRAACKPFGMVTNTPFIWSAVRWIQASANIDIRTYIQTIDDDFVDSILISRHSCGNLPPVSQPHILALKDEGGVTVELIVQNHIEAVVCKEADNKYQAIKGGSESVQVVAADAFCCWRRELHTRIGKVRGIGRAMIGDCTKLVGIQREDCWGLAADFVWQTL